MILRTFGVARSKPRRAIFPMNKNTLIALVALSVIPAAWSAEEPAKLEKIMVTGSLAEPTAATGPQKLEKIMVTGSLADPEVAGTGPQKLEKIMVTGSLAKPMARVTAGHKR